MVSISHQDNRTVAPEDKVGLIAAVLLTLETVAFGIALPIPTAANAAYLASFLIAPTFVALIVAVHYTAPESKRIWSHLGLAFAVIYAVLCGLNYYVQLTVVRTNVLGAPSALIEMLRFTPGSLMFAQDMLGYTFLCLATLAAAPVFSGDRLSRWLKGLFIAHGLVFVVPLIFPTLSFSDGASGDEIGVLANLFWCALFAPIAVLLALYFRRRILHPPRRWHTQKAPLILGHEDP
jgi:hypothetical protein